MLISFITFPELFSNKNNEVSSKENNKTPPPPPTISNRYFYYGDFDDNGELTNYNHIKGSVYYVNEENQEYSFISPTNITISL